ncbi:transporter [Paraburkholderia sp. Tr-20389]|uniref:AEC family transporter n=1 Tax=Paraburkholderia sp. Tr-20389 TaxID=2703903 RepID=UPI0019820EF8|nr:AEC family transporter [Paraburkholderia sp. Tr-20389]MBN3758344.1 transporter [Paraburkholderia sp. Tr-20389]
MQGLMLIVGWMVCGAWLASKGWLGPTRCAGLNRLTIGACLSALVLQQMHRLPFDARIVPALTMPFVAFAAGTLAVLIAARIARLSRATAGCLILTVGVGNTSIVGLPLIRAYLGPRATGLALVADQGNFVVLCTVATLAAALCSGTRTSPADMLRRMVSYRPLQALAVGVALRPWTFPGWLDAALGALAAMLTPLGLVSTGAMLVLQRSSGRLGLFAFGAGLKLVFVPGVVLGCWLLFTQTRDLSVAISVMQAGMPPMIVAGLLAAERKLDPSLATRLIGLGIPLSLATTFLWSRSLKGMAIW